MKKIRLVQKDIIIFADEGLLECVVAQHEIDHLDGILITDSIREIYNIQRVSERKYGRNDKVMIKSLMVILSL